jgi:hypothetical protein
MTDATSSTESSPRESVDGGRQRGIRCAVRHDDELRPLARPGSDLLAHGLDRHALLGEGRGDLREHTRAVGDVEADVVPREGLPHVDHREVGVGGLPRTAATGHLVAGDGDDVTEDGGCRRVARRRRGRRT